MKDKIRILIAGGDMRQIYCAEKLSEQYEIAVIGFDEKYLPEGINSYSVENDKKLLYDCIVLPVPSLDEKGNVNTPCFDGQLGLSDIKKIIKTDGIIFVGRKDNRLNDFFEDIKIIDYMEREDLSLKNAIPTAEGAIQLALEELPVTLNGIKALIVGLGRIGMSLAVILKGFGADVTVAVRNSKGAAKARILGVKSVCTDELDTDYELVYNTVPNLIFTRELLSKFSDKTLFVDLASKPGGIDFESATELGKRVVWALGLPGKTAPITSGYIIAETISCMLSERWINYD